MTVIIYGAGYADSIFDICIDFRCNYGELYLFLFRLCKIWCRVYNSVYFRDFNWIDCRKRRAIFS